MRHRLSPPSVPDRTIRRSTFKWLLILILFLSLINLACIAVNYTLIFDSSGSGAGTVEIEILWPKTITENPNMNLEEYGPDSMLQSLEDDGWYDPAFTETDDGRYAITASYPFDPVDGGDRQLGDVMPGFTLSKQESESGHTYYTFAGETNNEQLAAMWVEVEKAAQEGIKTDSFPGVFSSGDAIDEIEVMSAAEVQALIDKYGPVQTSLTLILPGQTAVSASNRWYNRADYEAGKTNALIYNWDPSKPAVVPLEAVRRAEPDNYVDEDIAAYNLSSLLGQYNREIPAGNFSIFSSITPGEGLGFANNIIKRLGGSDTQTCGDYQLKVLAWLDEIRTSPDPERRALLAGLDYGPVQTNDGGHVAVVIYRRGDDWRKSGTVLDPWPMQKPEHFTMAEWENAFWWYDASRAAPDERLGQLYPHLDGDKLPSYPAAGDAGDLQRGLAVPTGDRILLASSPVTLLVTLPDGRRIGGLPDGTLINELPGEAHLYARPKQGAENDLEWLLFLPETAVEVSFTGIGDGVFHTLLATPEGSFGFGPQPIQAGEQATFYVDSDGRPNGLFLPDGSAVPPQTLTDETVAVAMGLEPPPETETAESTANEETAPIIESEESPESPGETEELTDAGSDSSGRLVVATAVTLVLCACAGIILLIGGLVWLLRRKRP